VAADNKLDYIGTLLEEEIDADSLIQALILAVDMHRELLTGRRMPRAPEINQVADFRPRKEEAKRSAIGTSKNQKLSERVQMPRPDHNDVIEDPDEEEKDRLLVRAKSKETKKAKPQPQPKQQPELSLKEQQRLEYEEAKLMDLIKLEEMKEKEQKSREFKQREIEQKEEISLKIAESRSKLSEEPDSKDPNAATIQIRLADGSKSVTRRFLKTAQIEELYLYIRSLGDESGLEDQSNEFELFQQNHVFNKMEATIEEEQLFPRAKIY